MKSERLYLLHIRDAAERILTYTQEGPSVFFSSSIGQDSVVRNFEIIGEATKNLSSEFRNDNRHVPWARMAALRDVLIHNYFDVDLDVVWGVVEAELPPVLKHIQDLIAATEKSP